MPNDPEFEKWLAAQRTYQKLDPYTLAFSAWRESRRVQMEQDCKAVRAFPSIRLTLDNSEFKSPEQAIREAFAKEQL